VQLGPEGHRGLTRWRALHYRALEGKLNFGKVRKFRKSI
jgi:hypothetical protein